MNISSRSSNIVKITQILRYLLSFDDNGKMNHTKLIKLLWAADRYHMRHYGRLVSDSNYVAMKFGPVSSLALDISQVKNDFALDEEDTKYIGYYLSADEKDTMATAANIEVLNYDPNTDEALILVNGTSQVDKRLNFYNKYHPNLDPENTTVVLEADKYPFFPEKTLVDLQLSQNVPHKSRAF